MIVSDKWIIMAPTKVIEKYLQEYNRQFPLLFIFNYTTNYVALIVSDVFHSFYILIQCFILLLST